MFQKLEKLLDGRARISLDVFMDPNGSGIMVITRPINKDGEGEEPVSTGPFPATEMREQLGNSLDSMLKPEETPEVPAAEPAPEPVKEESQPFFDF